MQGIKCKKEKKYHPPTAWDTQAQAQARVPHVWEGSPYSTALLCSILWIAFQKHLLVVCHMLEPSGNPYLLRLPHIQSNTALSSVVSIIHLGLNTLWAPHTRHTCISPEHLNECGGSQNWVNHQCQLFREYNIIKDEISTSNLGNIYDYHVCLYVCLCVCWIILYVSQPLIAILTVHQYATAIF